MPVRFLVIVTGRDCVGLAADSLASIRAQAGGHEVQVRVVDDASTDGTGQLVERLCAAFGAGWECQVNTGAPLGAMANQYLAWHTFDDPRDDDVVLWCDLDDRLAHDGVFDRVAAEYAAGALMTFGSYSSEPFSPTCAPAVPYPLAVARAGSHRAFIRGHGGIGHNHCRTVSWGILKQITLDDCQDRDGKWWEAGPDFAVMLPALELSRERCHFIPDVLYVYSSSLPSAEWRQRPTVVNAVHREILSRPPRGQVTVTPRQRRESVLAARNARLKR